MKRIFKIGSFCFRIFCWDELPIPSNFLLFEVAEDSEIQYTYQISITDKLPLFEGRKLAGRDDIAVYESRDGEMRYIGGKGSVAFYACYRERSASEAEVLLALRELSDLQFDTVFTSLFALERRMIRQDSLILHCAYMEYQGKAILFSAPSETGKSTQAGLWERYRGSRTVNGDRALLRKIENRWTACGWPVCGSSEICHLGDTPIYAIVMLRQGKVNQAERLSPIQAFALLYAQITINQWNRDFVQQAIILLEELVAQIPVYQLTCDMTEDAVRCLEAVLFPGTVKEQQSGTQLGDDDHEI